MRDSGIADGYKGIGIDFTRLQELEIMGLKLQLYGGGIIILACCFIVSCSRDTSQPSSGKDYRQMLERVRQRNEVERGRQELLRSLETFQVDLGRLPTNLYELVVRRYMDDIPALPEGMAYQYHPDRGRIDIVRLPPQ